MEQLGPRRAAALHRLPSGLEDAGHAADAAGDAAHGAPHREGGGLRYVYTGNIHDPEGQSTYCHGCGAALIGRDWYELTAWNLTPTAGAPLRNAMRRRVRGDPRPMGTPAPAGDHAGGRDRCDRPRQPLALSSAVRRSASA